MINLNEALFFSLGELQYSPAVLQQQMAAELQYLESIEESMKQMGDIERLMGVSVAQQESASLAQMLKVKETFLCPNCNKDVRIQCIIFVFCSPIYICMQSHYKFSNNLFFYISLLD